jgi:hypothetical protein
MNYTLLVNRLAEIGSAAFRAETEGLLAQVESAYAQMQTAVSMDDRLSFMIEAGQLEEVMNVRFELLEQPA